MARDNCWSPKAIPAAPRARPPRARSAFCWSSPSDVPVYVEYGAADLGIVGQDALWESGRDLYEPLQLGFGRCRLVLAGLPSQRERNFRLATGLRVATKYPRLARAYFQQQGLSVEIIPLTGSIELAPLVSLADLVVDVVETGRTMRENGLVELEEIVASQATMVVNRVAYRLRLAELRELLAAMSAPTAVEREHSPPGDREGHIMSIRILEGFAAARAHIQRLRDPKGAALPESVAVRLCEIFGRDLSAEEAVAQIVADVRREGDAALRDYARRIDGIPLESFSAGASALEAAYLAQPAELREALHLAAGRIRAFHEREPHQSWLDWDEEGGALGQVVRPLQRVGVYVPAARRPIPRRCSWPSSRRR